MLFEGAQGALLDIDFGTYPFVTSSNPIAGAACTGTGVGPTRIDHVIGVAKAYTTRVGEGPFPTELFDDVGAAMCEVGHEFGTTTGRQRRCGWLDLVALRYAVRLSGITHLAITKLDVLTGLPTLKVCTRYKAGRKVLDEFPLLQTDFHHAKPVYEELPGWTEDLRDCEDLAGPAPGGPRLRAVHRGVHQDAGEVHRRGPGPRRDHRAAAQHRARRRRLSGLPTASRSCTPEGRAHEHRHRAARQRASGPGDAWAPSTTAWRSPGATSSSTGGCPRCWCSP